MNIESRTAGRRRNAEATRAAILESARTNFARFGFDGVGVREIAADAGIDAALISRYFSGKEGLFRAVMELSVKPEELFYGSPGDFSARITNIFFDEEQNPSNLDYVLMMVRSVSSAQAREIINQMTDEPLDSPVVEWIGEPNGRARMRLLGAMLMGMGATRMFRSDFGLSPRHHETMREYFRSMIYALLTDDLPDLQGKGSDRAKGRGKPKGQLA